VPSSEFLIDSLLATRKLATQIIMTLTEKIRQMERVDALIRRKATGSPASLATRLGTSERYVYKLINMMKNLGAPIYFNYEKNSYCYEEDVVFFVGFRLRNDAANRAMGGQPYFFCHCTIRAVYPCIFERLY